MKYIKYMKCLVIRHFVLFNISKDLLKYFGNLYLNLIVLVFNDLILELYIS